MKFKIESERIYLENLNKKVIAEITFKDGVIDHTFVDESLRGQGVASKLVEMAVLEIEKKGIEARATCSYAKKWLEKNR